jgi:hypothetical protein
MAASFGPSSAFNYYSIIKLTRGILRLRGEAALFSRTIKKKRGRSKLTMVVVEEQDDRNERVSHGANLSFIFFVVLGE